MTPKEFLQAKYPQMRGDNWNIHEIIDDNWVAQMMQEYKDKEFSLNGVGCSLPTKEEMFIEELQRYNLEKEWDERVNRSDFSKGFIECYKWITNQDFKVR
jgi:hypothetical protein